MKTLTPSNVPEVRVRTLADNDVDNQGDFVLYWMVAHRRPHWNYSLQRSLDWCRALRKPLLVLEALRCDYQWASDRFHRFVLQGMSDNRDAFRTSPVAYYPYVEPQKRAGRGLLDALCEHAAVLVTDDFPCFFLPRMLQAVAHRCPVLMEAIDGNGLLPLRATKRVFSVAHSFRRFLQKELPDHLVDAPCAAPLADYEDVPGFDPSKLRRTQKRWPPADLEARIAPQGLANLPLDHQVGTTPLAGGYGAAEKLLADFFRHRLNRYPQDRNHPDADAASGLSPYLHFGHISAHAVFHRLMEQEDWTPDQLADRPNGKRHGWWNASEAAESFLDELITWRELGYNGCAHQEDYDRFESLPGWALETLREHQDDPRPVTYTLDEFETSQTHDALWNAAQRQLVQEGRIHNYLRMLWGKKILHWSGSPQEALRTMIHLNNKYALDGRDPNSYSGIFWVLGKYDRAWGPERPIFGKVRYMTSQSTKRKLRLSNYLETFGDKPE